MPLFLLTYFSLIKFIKIIYFVLKSPIPCKLWVETPIDCLEVADERIVMGSKTVHHEPIPLNHLRVCIDIVYDGCQEYEVPYPAKEGTFLAELIRDFLIWPSNLIHPTHNVF
jgi:hypothetical protein